MEDRLIDRTPQVGHPKHVQKALDVGVDIICAQAGEGGGHTGDVPASILIPACVDAVKGRTSPLNGKPIYVIGAGAVYDGRSLAANLMWGAQAVCKYLWRLLMQATALNDSQGLALGSLPPWRLARRRSTRTWS